MGLGAGESPCGLCRRSLGLQTEGAVLSRARQHCWAAPSVKNAPASGLQADLHTEASFCNHSLLTCGTSLCPAT